MVVGLVIFVCLQSSRLFIVNSMSHYLTPTLEIESALSGSVCGIDEAGRGPLAGPAYAAAVTLGADTVTDEFNDSKRLSAQARTEQMRHIFATCDVGIGIANVEEIDRLNILGATMLAMQRAYECLGAPTTHALVDGNRAPNLPCRIHTLVKGDARSLSVAAASIVAKVLRDEAMQALCHLYPDYGFSRHAGYGTRIHKEGMQRHGVTLQHRRSFRPVRELVE